MELLRFCARGGARMAAVHSASRSRRWRGCLVAAWGVGRARVRGRAQRGARGTPMRWRKSAASAPPAVVAGPRAVGGLVWVTGGVPAAGVAARG
eukprot:6709643-Prymnesium_polylepis.1